MGLSPDARQCLRVDVIAGMAGDRDCPRLGGVLQLAVIAPRADNDPTVSAESLENVANLHAQISSRAGRECKARAIPSTIRARGLTG